MKDFVYDIESYPNVFTITFKQGINYWWYEISHRRNDVEELIHFLTCLKRNKDRMIGFNNIGYDYPVLHFVINNRPCAEQIYNKSMSIIESEDRFSHIIWGRDQYTPQVDLFKIHHFDNLAKSTSLKMLEFNMRFASIQDLPFPPGTILNDEQINTLLVYNKHDVDATAEFLEKSRSEIEFREKLTEKYKRNFLNHNDTKIGKDYFLMKLEEYSPGCTKINGQPRQTMRPSININDVILSYLQFKNPAFIALRDWFSHQRITKTKGAFIEINEYSLGSLFQYCNTRLKRKKGEHCVLGSWYEYKENKKFHKVWTEQKPDKPLYTCWNEAKNLNCMVNGFQFDFGTGGIHGSVESQTILSDEQGQIIDVDVAAFYPNIAIKNKLYPEHLGETFCHIYADVLAERAKHKKGTTENKMMKLAANGTFGDTNSVFSSFYDPQYTMAITINGQLLLCLLADHVTEIPGLKMIQANTDGITVKCPHNQVDRFMQICKWWEQYTCLDLEYVNYSRMWIRDVNNYLAENGPNEKKPGKLKQKGAYLDEPEWHKNHSSIVVAKAACAVLSQGADVRQFIYEHSDTMDFLLRTKVPRKSKLMHGDQQVQNITRYYISNDGKPLIKIMPPTAKKPDKWRNIGINVGWLTTECNEWKGVLPGINYEYYIQEAEKLILPLQ